MKDHERTRDELLVELAALRKTIERLENDQLLYAKQALRSFVFDLRNWVAQMGSSVMLFECMVENQNPSKDIADYLLVKMRATQNKLNRMADYSVIDDVYLKSVDPKATRFQDSLR